MRRWTGAMSCVLVLGAVAAAASCDTFVPEAQLAGVFELRTLDGDAVPAVIWAEDGTEARLISETLTFDGEGDVRRVASFEFRDQASGEVEGSTTTLDHQYRIRSWAIAIGSFRPCPPNALCLANDEGAWSQDRVEVVGGFHGFVPAVYRRAEGPE